MSTVRRWIVRAWPALLLLALAVAPASARRMQVEVWTDRGDDAVYEPGAAMRVKVSVNRDAYLLVYAIDAEGEIDLLYPWRRGRGMVEGGRTLRLPPTESNIELVVDRSTGQGFVVAVASERPFRALPWFLRPYDPQAEAIGYDRDEAADADDEFVDREGRVVGDPYVAIERIRRRVMAFDGESEDLDSDYTTYYVHERVRYPRYLCADCHRPGMWTWWDGFDPYYTRCSVFDFRVNFEWTWGPRLYSAHVPYYHYVVRHDCPPHYRTWDTPGSRFSSWDGWRRWDDLWGGPLRRWKDARPPVPQGYQPPPLPGQVWKQPTPPPGVVSPRGGRAGGESDGPTVRRRPGAPRPGGAGEGGGTPGVTRDPGARPGADRVPGSPRSPGVGRNDQPRDESGSGGRPSILERIRPGRGPATEPGRDGGKGSGDDGNKGGGKDGGNSGGEKKDPPRSEPPPGKGGGLEEVVKKRGKG